MDLLDGAPHHAHGHPRRSRPLRRLSDQGRGRQVPQAVSVGDEEQEASVGAPTLDPVAWDVAERVAVRIASREPLAESYLYASLAPDFEEYTAEAEELVA